MSDTMVLGRPAEIPTDPATAPLDRVPNPHADIDYLIRFTVPEFTALCPITGQPDFAHLVIDYVADKWMIESKSLKLFMFSFRNHGSFHESTTVMIGKRLVEALEPRWLQDRRLLVSARRHADRRVLADRRAAQGRVAARSGRRALSRPRLAILAAAGGSSRSMSIAASRSSPWRPTTPAGTSTITG